MHCCFCIHRKSLTSRMQREKVRQMILMKVMRKLVLILIESGNSQSADGDEKVGIECLTW